LISKDLLGCASARNKGTCDNRLNIRRDALETSVLKGLETHLMEPELFKEFCAEFTREVNRLRIERGADLSAMRAELPRIDRELDKLLKLILASDDIDASKRVMREMKELEIRKEGLEKSLAEAEEPPPLLHPNMAEIYRQRISTLYESLGDEDGKTQAAEVFRTLVDQVTLVPDEDELAIVLRGDLAAILTFASANKRPAFLTEAGVLGDLISPASVVAGRRTVLDLRDSQFEMVAGLPSRLELLISSDSCEILWRLAACCPGGLFHAAA
jgi:hypothetical protein